MNVMTSGRAPRQERATTQEQHVDFTLIGTTLPSPQSLEGRLLACLLDGESLTAADWLRPAGSMRLASEVHQLRELGWLVRSDLIMVGTRDRTGDGVRRARVARYALDAEQRVAVRAAAGAARFVCDAANFEQGVSHV